MRLDSRLALSVITLAVGVLAQSAGAVTLTEPVSPAPFADTALLGTSSAARPELAGTVLEDDLTAFSFSGISGTVQNRVVRETSSGTLDFYWKVDVDPASTAGGVSAFRLDQFGYDNIKDADWRSDGLGSVAASTGRLFNVSSYPTGDVNFLFGDGIRAGSSSYFFFLHTDAVNYARTARFDLVSTSDSISGLNSTFAPAVPEPSTYGLVASGLVVAGLWSRRRQKR
ncbi:MAG TPA: PEP-CTERM sorting domain-containing protein [Aquabacterium sp.]|nr:PEP-CTERM sorting domain-containing protein [Aquabacterium sp.]